MTCPNCGAAVSTLATQCPICSVPLAGQPTSPAPGTQPPKPVISRPPGGDRYTGPPTHNGLATAALVLGIVSIPTLCLTALPAIICGIIALAQINGSQGRMKGTGMAITGMLLPLLVPVIASLLFPIIARSR